MSTASYASKVEVSTSQYEFSHGKAPKGTGSWAFEPYRSKDSSQIFWAKPSQTYAAAAKEARQHFAAQGVDYISACP